jgi:hypothetical protein
MPVVLLLAAVAILAGVVVVAMGRGGELSLPRPDSAAYGRSLVTAADMVTFRPPAAFLGYSAPATDDALQRIARAVAERDAELITLRREVAILRARQAQPGGAGRAVPYADPATYADPGAYANPGAYADLDTPADPYGYESPLSFSASRGALAPGGDGPPWELGDSGHPERPAGARPALDAGGALESYESEPGRADPEGWADTESSGRGAAQAGPAQAGAAWSDAGWDGVSRDFGEPDAGGGLFPAGSAAEPEPGSATDLGPTTDPGAAPDPGAVTEAGAATDAGPGSDAGSAPGAGSVQDDGPASDDGPAA